jgi:hypothetical protein
VARRLLLAPEMVIHLGIQRAFGQSWTPRRTGCFRPDGGAKGLIAVFGA